jgi:hypothetical protein
MIEATKNVGISEDEEELWTNTETGEASLWDEINIIVIISKIKTYLKR